jgi:hypothetical protein
VTGHWTPQAAGSTCSERARSSLPRARRVRGSAWVQRQYHPCSRACLFRGEVPALSATAALDGGAGPAGSPAGCCLCALTSPRATRLQPPGGGQDRAWWRTPPTRRRESTRARIRTNVSVRPGARFLFVPAVVRRPWRGATAGGPCRACACVCGARARAAAGGGDKVPDEAVSCGSVPPGPPRARPQPPWPRKLGEGKPGRKGGARDAAMPWWWRGAIRSDSPTLLALLARHDGWRSGYPILGPTRGRGPAQALVLPVASAAASRSYYHHHLLHLGTSYVPSSLLVLSAKRSRPGQSCRRDACIRVRRPPGGGERVAEPLRRWTGPGAVHSTRVRGPRARHGWVWRGSECGCAVAGGVGGAGVGG